MKNILKIALVLAALSAGSSASAQSIWAWQRENHKISKHANRSPYSIRIGYSGYPDVIAERFTDGYYHIGAYLDNYIGRPSIAEMYKDFTGTVYGTGVFSGEFIWNAGRVFNLSGTFGLCPMWTTAFDGVTGDKKCPNFGLAMVILPELKLMYCNTPTVRVYSSFGLGLGLYPGFKEASSIIGEGQFVPVGIEIGRRWYGFGEIGVGTLYMGGQFGVGYRFANRRTDR